MESLNKFLEELENGEIELELETEKVKCSCCGNMVDKKDCKTVSGELVCEDCIMEYYFYCAHCGKIIHVDDGVWFRDELYCEDCVDDLFCECDDCGELMWRDDGYFTHNGYHICDNCRDNYTYCYECDELFQNDDVYWDEETDNAYCYDCYQLRTRRRTIKNYSYKPLPIFYGRDSKLFMGVELEVDKGGKDDYNASILCDIMNECTERIYCKHDGSLHDGFEIVSHPCTLEYHSNFMAWRELMQKAKEFGYRSHDTDTCGLHVHVSRSALGDTYDEQEHTIAKIVYFIENNWNCIVRFTRRATENIEHWADKCGIESTIEETYEKAKGSYNRYVAVNLQNSNTIEFRIFRGTLKHSTFIATLQFVTDLCEVCEQLTMEAISNLNWFDFVEMIPVEHAELIDYLRNRNLY